MQFKYDQQTLTVKSNSDIRVHAYNKQLSNTSPNLVTATS